MSTFRVSDTVDAFANSTSTAVNIIRNQKGDPIRVSIAPERISEGVVMNSTDAGQPGSLRHDETFLYLCADRNSWVRVPFTNQETTEDSQQIRSYFVSIAQGRSMLVDLVADGDAAIGVAVNDNRPPLVIRRGSSTSEFTRDLPSAFPAPCRGPAVLSSDGRYAFLRYVSPDRVRIYVRDRPISLNGGVWTEIAPAPSIPSDHTWLFSLQDGDGFITAGPDEMTIYMRSVGISGTYSAFSTYTFGNLVANSASYKKESQTLVVTSVNPVNQTRIFSVRGGYFGLLQPLVPTHALAPVSASVNGARDRLVVAAANGTTEAVVYVYILQNGSWTLAQTIQMPSGVVQMRQIILSRVGDFAVCTTTNGEHSIVTLGINALTVDGALVSSYSYENGFTNISTNEEGDRFMAGTTSKILDEQDAIYSGFIW